MNEELELLKWVAAGLKSVGIEYMMTGSMAMALYAMPRMTRDIDIIVQISPLDIDTILDLFRYDFYIEEESVRSAVKNRGMFNIIHNDSIIKVDLIILKNEAYRIEEFSRRKQIRIEETTVFVVTPEDLILSKLVWSERSQSGLQLRDVRQILFHVKELDLLYLEKWSKILGVDDLFTRMKTHE